MPRAALWRALQKLRVPDGIVELGWSFHDGMKARICIDREPLEEEISVDNGLRQSCTMVPSFFNLYACLLAEQ